MIKYCFSLWLLCYSLCGAAQPPAKLPEPKPVKQVQEPSANTLSLLHLEDGTLKAYQGVLTEKTVLKNIPLNDAAIKAVIQEAQEKLPKETEIVVWLKEPPKANYKQVTDLLDRFRILKIKKYLLLEMNEAELKLAGINVPPANQQTEKKEEIDLVETVSDMVNEDDATSFKLVFDIEDSAHVYYNTGIVITESKRQPVIPFTPATIGKLIEDTRNAAAQTGKPFKAYVAAFDFNKNKTFRTIELTLKEKTVIRFIKIFRPE
jgi:hypothetical protein